MLQTQDVKLSKVPITLVLLPWTAWIGPPIFPPSTALALGMNQ